MPIKFAFWAKNFFFSNASPTHFYVNRFAMVFGQFRLEINQIHLARPSIHIKVNAGLGLGREVSSAWFKWISIVGK